MRLALGAANLGDSGEATSPGGGGGGGGGGGRQRAAAPAFGVEVAEELEASPCSTY